MVVKKLVLKHCRCMCSLSVWEHWAGEGGRRRENVVSRRLHFSLLFWLAGSSLGRSGPSMFISHQQKTALHGHQQLSYKGSRIKLGGCFLCMCDAINTASGCGGIFIFPHGGALSSPPAPEWIWRKIIISAQPAGLQDHAHVQSRKLPSK